MNTADVLQQFRSFRNETDALTRKLYPLYVDGMQCRKGCSSCCIHLALLPLEIYVISLEAGIPLCPDQAGRLSSGVCPFLKEDGCTIYPHRPLICRVFGFPQLWLTEEWDVNGNRLPDEAAELLADWCELNFEGVRADRALQLFGREKMVPMSTLNRRLEQLNTLFLEQTEGSGFTSRTRYLLGDLLCLTER